VQVKVTDTQAGMNSVSLASRFTTTGRWRTATESSLPSRQTSPGSPSSARRKSGMAVLEATPIIIKPEDHLGLAHAVASQFVRPTDEVKDTEQYSVACYCLVKAAKEYDEAVGPFSTFAWRAMRNGIIEHLRRKNRKKRRADFETGYDLEQVVDTADSDLLPVELLL